MSRCRARLYYHPAVPSQSLCERAEAIKACRGEAGGPKGTKRPTRVGSAGEPLLSSSSPFTRCSFRTKPAMLSHPTRTATRALCRSRPASAAARAIGAASPRPLSTTACLSALADLEAMSGLKPWKGTQTAGGDTTHYLGGEWTAGDSTHFIPVNDVRSPFSSRPLSRGVGTS